MVEHQNLMKLCTSFGNLVKYDDFGCFVCKLKAKLKWEKVFMKVKMPLKVDVFSNYVTGY